MSTKPITNDDTKQALTEVWQDLNRMGDDARYAWLISQPELVEQLLKNRNNARLVADLCAQQCKQNRQLAKFLAWYDQLALTANNVDNTTLASPDAPDAPELPVNYTVTELAAYLDQQVAQYQQAGSANLAATQRLGDALDAALVWWNAQPHNQKFNQWVAAQQLGGHTYSWSWMQRHRSLAKFLRAYPRLLWCGASASKLARYKPQLERHIGADAQRAQFWTGNK